MKEIKTEIIIKKKDGDVNEFLRQLKIARDALIDSVDKEATSDAD